MAELKKAACALFELAEKDVELSDYYNNKIYSNLDSAEKADKKLEEVQITGPQHIFLGEQVCILHCLLPSVSACLVQHAQCIYQQTSNQDVRSAGQRFDVRLCISVQCCVCFCRAQMGSGRTRSQRSMRGRSRGPSTQWSLARPSA